MLFRGLLVGAASGKMGAMVASHNSGGQYMRARVTPTNPSTLRQQVVRNNLAALANRFSTVLDSSQRLSWKSFALSLTGILNALGDPITLSAIAAYIRQNAARTQAGLDIIDDPPIDGTAAVLANSTNAETATNDLSVVFTTTDLWNADGGGALLIYTGRPLNPGEDFYKGPYRLAGIVDANTAPQTTPATVIGGNTAWGEAVSGQTSRVRLVAVTGDGRISNVVNGKLVMP